MNKQQFKQMLIEIINEERQHVRNGRTPICDLVNEMVKISEKRESWNEARAWT